MKREWVIRTSLFMTGIFVGLVISLNLSSRYKIEGNSKRIDTWTGKVWLLEFGETKEYGGRRITAPSKWTRVIEP